MRSPVDHALVESLLRDTDLSYREIGRRAGCSDFTVRAISRKLADHRHATSAPEAEAEPLTLRDWGIVGVIAAVFFGGVWLISRQLPPPECELM